MDKHLEKLLSELGEAINDAIQRSDEVSDVMERIRATGNDILLAVEATIALAEPNDESSQFREIPIEERLQQISAEDKQFLRSLKIKFDHDEE